MDPGVISSIIAGIFSLVGVWMSLSNKNKFKKKEMSLEEILKVPPLEQHKIFSHLKDYERLIITMDIELKIDNAGRRRLAREFLLQSLNAWYEPLNDFIEFMENCAKTCTTNNNECNRIYMEAMKLFEDGISYYTIDYRSIYVENPADAEAMHIFRNKFIQWNNDRVDRLKDKINEVCNENDFYKFCDMKAGRLLEAIDDYLYDTIADARATSIRLNGELTGKLFKGDIL